MDLHQQIAVLLGRTHRYYLYRDLPCWIHFSKMNAGELASLLQQAHHWMVPSEIRPEDIQELDRLIRSSRLEALTSPVDWIRRWAAESPEAIAQCTSTLFKNSSRMRLFVPDYMKPGRGSSWVLDHESDPEREDQ